MTLRRSTVLFGGLLLLSLVALMLRWVPETKPTPGRESALVSRPTPASVVEPPLTVADRLGAADGSIIADLRILSDVFEAYRNNFPKEGSPVGENVDITAALTGRNALRLPVVRRDHPAINAAGELCDRWGTPFFFHQLSGYAMEVRSAGPDRRLHTADDVVLTP